MWLVVFVTTVDSAVQKLIWKTVDFSKTFKDWLPHLQIVQQSAGGEQRESQINDPNTVTMFVHLKEDYTTQEGSVSCKESKIKISFSFVSLAQSTSPPWLQKEYLKKVKIKASLVILISEVSLRRSLIFHQFMANCDFLDLLMYLLNWQTLWEWVMAPVRRDQGSLLLHCHTKPLHHGPGFIYFNIYIVRDDCLFCWVKRVLNSILWSIKVLKSKLAETCSPRSLNLRCHNVMNVWCGWKIISGLKDQLDEFQGCKGRI